MLITVDVRLTVNKRVVKRIKCDSLEILDKQKTYLESKIDQEDIELKKRDLTMLISERLNEAKKKNMSASV